jgi:hypothetical protein
MMNFDWNSFPQILTIIGVIFLIMVALVRIIEKYLGRSEFSDSDNHESDYTSLNIPVPSTELSRRTANETPPQPRSSVSPSKLIPSSPGKGLTIFVSYRRQDSGDATGRIYDRLVQHFGRESIFKDVDSIPLGMDFRNVLGDAVGQCDLLLAVIGHQWLKIQNEGPARRLDNPRDFVRIEIESAMQRDIPVIPLLVQGAGMPGENDLPRSLQALVYRNAISIRPDPDFHHDVDRLIKGIELLFKNNL